MPVLTAVTGPWEAALAAGLGGETQVRLVRRCADLAELLAAALAGLAGGVVLSADLPRLDGDALARLRAAGVGVVVLVAPGDTEAAQRMRLLGVADLLPADTPPPAVARAVAAAVSGIRLSAPSGGHLGGPGTGEPPRSGDVVQAAAAAVPPDDPRDRPVGPAPGPAGPA
ncbi:MAG TPA: hypothetical protein VFP72_21685, partial [Kineosporiaceae bacterium]|nr:hypothetical protein [Kineosporiaceae bacterium]